MNDVQTLTKEKIKLDEPGLYDVVHKNKHILLHRRYTKTDRA